MGFWIMTVTFLAGVIFIALGISKTRTIFLKISMVIIGLLLICFAIFLATPFGADLLSVTLRI